MRNTFGNNISITLFGESHGEAIGAVLDGIPAGITIDYDFISHQLMLRQPFGKISTPRVEKDEFKIVSGVFDGKTCGTPICIIIENRNTKSQDYSELLLTPRPSHADYSSFCKHGEIGILPGGGHFSGRITAPIVAAGAIVITVLNQLGIKIGTHIKKIGNICDEEFSDYSLDIDELNNKRFAVLNENVSSSMIEKIEEIQSQNDSIGGMLETAIIGLESGVGEPWFDTTESMLSHAIFSIPAVKGVEFGLGFDICEKLGSQVNDQFCYVDGSVQTKSNNSGGIMGGITNGQPIVFRTAIKPTPTISKEQDSVNLKTGENTVLAAKGRHDPCIVHRARVVVDSITAITILDLLFSKYGAEGIKNGIRTDR